MGLGGGKGRKGNGVIHYIIISNTKDYHKIDLKREMSEGFKNISSVFLFVCFVFQRWVFNAAQADHKQLCNCR